VVVSAITCISLLLLLFRVAYQPCSWYPINLQAVGKQEKLGSVRPPGEFSSCQLKSHCHHWPATPMVPNITLVLRSYPGIPIFFFSRTTVTVQISTRASRYCKYLYLLSGYRSSEQQRCGHLNFGSYYFSNLTRLDERGETVFTYTRTMKSYLGIHFINVFYLHFSTFKAVLIVQLTFIDFNY